MCAVSAVSNYYKQWPGAGGFPDQGTFHPQPVIPTSIMQDPEALELLRKAVEILDRLDKRIGDRECDDEAKEAFLDTLGANLGIE